jgi:hypothetical protein
MSDNRKKFEAAVVQRLKESGFLEIEIRTEALVRCEDGYQDEVINAGWHYWNAALVATGKATSAPMVMLDMSADELAELQALAARAPGDIIAVQPVKTLQAKSAFSIGDLVRKRSGSWWEGRVVGFYSTEQTPDGVCVQLDKPLGPVQIYPASALELVEELCPELRSISEYVSEELQQFAEPVQPPPPSSHVAVETVRALETANAPKHMIEAACKAINDRGKGNNVTIADVAFMLDAAISASPAQRVEWGDWTVDDTDTAREIMNYLGYGSDASREPGADRRRDKIAAMIRARIDAATAPSPEKHVLGLSDAQVDAVLHLVESRLCIIWPKIGAREEFANLLRVLEPAPEEPAEICEACGEPFEDGDLVYWMADDTGHIHADCCGPERESYVGPDGAPLKDGDPIPEPFAYRDPRAATESQP